MTIEDNKAVVCRFHAEMLERRSLEHLSELVAPDFVELELYAGQEQGRDGLRKFWETYLAAFPDAVWKLESQIAEGEMVVSLFNWRGTHRGPFAGLPATGRPVSSASLFIDRIRDGRLVERRSFHDAYGVLQQLGDIPPPGGRRPRRSAESRGE